MEALSSQSSIVSVSGKQPSGILSIFHNFLDNIFGISVNSSFVDLFTASLAFLVAWAEGSSSLLSDVRSAVYTLMSHLT